MKIGLLGVGTVGAALVGLLAERGRGVQVAKALVRDAARARPGLAANQLSDDPQAVLAAGELIVELMGGAGLAGTTRDYARFLQLWPNAGTRSRPSWTRAWCTARRR